MLLIDGSMVMNCGSGYIYHLIYKKIFYFINFSETEISFKIQIEDITDKRSYKMKEQKHCLS